MKIPRQSLVFSLAGLVWFGCVTWGTMRLWEYQNSPGTPGNPPQQWPSQSTLRRSPGRPTLVLLAHPHCPCTRSTIGELAKLMTRLSGQLTAYVLFYAPEGFSPAWEKTDLWQSAASIPGVQVFRDENGQEAQFFGAATSGQTLVYDGQGHLLFSGGITAARGHFGDNAGETAIVAWLTTITGGQKSTPVYGCSLKNRTEKTSWMN
jgi:hypothetical protein